MSSIHKKGNGGREKKQVMTEFKQNAGPWAAPQRDWAYFHKTLTHHSLQTHTHFVYDLFSPSILLFSLL